MSRLVRTSCALLWLFVACGRSVNDAGGETNWLSCDTDEDCPAESRCVASRCTEPVHDADPDAGDDETPPPPDDDGIALGECPAESSFSTVEAPAWEGGHVLVKITGESRGTLGESAFVGDVDGDGYGDFVVMDVGGSGPQASLDVQARGAAYLFYGRAPFEGEASDTGAGGEGGAGGAESDGGAGGAVEPFLEPFTELAASQADMIVRGANRSVSGLGDINGDGYDDFAVVAACDSDCDSVVDGVHIFYGAADRYSGDWRADEIGAHWVVAGSAYRVVRAGDVNGDDYADVLVEASVQDNPSIYVTYLLLGRAEPLDEALPDGSHDAVFVGDDVAMRSGAAGVGDIDDDGYDDLLFSVGESDCSAGGFALFYGADRFSTTLTPEQADASFSGASVWYVTGAIGDLDTDGYADLALPSEVTESDVKGVPGFVAVIYGRSERFSGAYDLANVMDFSVHPLAALDGLAAGDLDGDGQRDLLVGDSKDQTTGFQAGSLSVLPGSQQRLSGSFELTPASAVIHGESFRGGGNDMLGYGTSSGGDVNGDGYDDSLVGATGNTIGDEDGGKVFLILGQP